MPKYPERFNAKDYDELKEIVVKLGEAGSFDANDLLFVYDARHPGLVNAGSVAQILQDLVDLGVIRPLPPRWELTE